MNKYLKIIIGSLLISLSFSLFFIPNNIISNGTYGIAILLNYKTGYDPALFLLIVNFMLIVKGEFNIFCKCSKIFGIVLCISRS